MTKRLPPLFWLVAFGCLGGCGSGAGGGADGGAGGGGTAGAKGTLPACPGETQIPSTQTTCRTNADCPMPLWGCGPAYSGGGPGGCGICIAPQHECTVDGDCGQGKVCLPRPSTPCECVGMGPDTMCAAACTAASCAANETCDTASGHCKPTPCGAAFACKTGFVCAPTRAGADGNGCAVANCATDGYACPAGWVCGAGQSTDVNGCSAVSCVGGQYKCPVNEDCVATSQSPHHCARRACTSDRQCDCGACIQGSCQNRFFVCSPPPAA
jgi:hypothetical protein